MSRILVDGVIREIADLDIIGPQTKTIEFPLNDGSKLTMMITITRIHRALDEFNDVGEPVYGSSFDLKTRVKDIPQEFYGKPSQKKAIKPAKPGPEIA